LFAGLYVGLFPRCFSSLLAVAFLLLVAAVADAQIILPVEPSELPTLNAVIRL